MASPSPSLAFKKRLDKQPSKTLQMWLILPWARGQIMCLLLQNHIFLPRCVSLVAPAERPVGAGAAGMPVDLGVHPCSPLQKGTRLQRHWGKNFCDKTYSYFLSINIWLQIFKRCFDTSRLYISFRGT